MTERSTRPAEPQQTVRHHRKTYRQAKRAIALHSETQEVLWFDGRKRNPERFGVIANKSDAAFYQLMLTIASASSPKATLVT
jgi:hypothetical protein